ncbi:MAG: TonB family protein [Acidobacteria bacterium]|nr:TonB family protein [Acidobacteriota bacterium]
MLRDGSFSAETLAASTRDGSPETSRMFASLPEVSTLRNIATNLAACLTPLPKPPVEWAFAPMLRSAYLKRHSPGRSLLTSALLHVGVIACLLRLPSLPGPAPRRHDDNSKREHAVIWYNREELLPLVSPPKTVAPAERRQTTRAPMKGETAEARQTIISRPPNPDNQRQTIVQPEVPELKIPSHVELPNIVQWTAVLVPPRPITSEAPRVLSQIQMPRLPAPVVAPPTVPVPPPPELRMQAHAETLSIMQPNGVAMPPRPIASEAMRPLARIDVPRLPVPAVAPPLPEPPSLAEPSRNMASLGVPKAMLPGAAKPPPMPEAPAVREPTRNIAGVGVPKAMLPGVARPPMPAPPALNPSSSAASGGLHNLIAVGVAPAPPPPEQISIPQGNRAGEFAVLAGNGKAGQEGSTGVENGAAEGLTELADRDLGGIRVPHLAITGPDTAPRLTDTPGAIVAPPTVPRPSAPNPTPRPGDEELARLIAKATRPSLLPSRSRELDPEVQVFGARRVYTVSINMPNLTSGSGSWVLRFAELNGSLSGSKDDNISTPVAVRKVDPRYVPSAVRDRVQGTVTLGAYIMRDGTVTHIRVLTGLDPRLDSSAAAALADWQFVPARKNGVPVDLEIVVQIPFRLPSL